MEYLRIKEKIDAGLIVWSNYATRQDYLELKQAAIDFGYENEYATCLIKIETLWLNRNNIVNAVDFEENEVMLLLKFKFLVPRSYYDK